jgi:hypothetical protein
LQDQVLHTRTHTITQISFEKIHFPLHISSKQSHQVRSVQRHLGDFSLPMKKTPDNHYATLTVPKHAGAQHKFGIWHDWLYMEFLIMIKTIIKEIKTWKKIKKTKTSRNKYKNNSPWESQLQQEESTAMLDLSLAFAIALWSGINDATLPKTETILQFQSKNKKIN